MKEVDKMEEEEETTNETSEEETAILGLVNLLPKMGMKLSSKLGKRLYSQEFPVSIGALPFVFLETNCRLVEEVNKHYYEQMLSAKGGAGKKGKKGGFLRGAFKELTGEKNL